MDGVLFPYCKFHTSSYTPYLSNNCRLDAARSLTMMEFSRNFCQGGERKDRVFKRSSFCSISCNFSHKGLQKEQLLIFYIGIGEMFLWSTTQCRDVPTRWHLRLCTRKNDWRVPRKIASVRLGGELRERTKTAETTYSWEAELFIHVLITTTPPNSVSVSSGCAKPVE